MLVPTVAYLAMSLIAIAMALGLFRLLAGPTVPDRILGFDSIAISVMAATAVLSVMWDTTLYLEILLIFGLLGFFSTVVFVVFLRHRQASAVSNPRTDTDASASANPAPTFRS